jgi:hypothetical protein
MSFGFKDIFHFLRIKILKPTPPTVSVFSYDSIVTKSFIFFSQVKNNLSYDSFVYNNLNFDSQVKNNLSYDSFVYNNLNFDSRVD